MDPLTGLPTRHDLDPSVAVGAPFALLVDLDGFIWVNDQFGHQVGDQALVTVATALANTFRDVELTRIFRVTGDSFLVVLPGIDTDAMAAASRVVEAVRALNIPYRRVDRPERRRVEVNVAVLRLTAQHLAQYFKDAGMSDAFAELIHREKQRRGDQPGVIVDAR